MNDKNLTTSNIDFITYRDGHMYREAPVIEVELHNRKHTVRVLHEDEAKAKICEEYGFEYGAIRIEATCWYEATDMNYFKFSVGGRWVYEAEDYGALKLLDYYDSRPYRNFHASLGRRPQRFQDGLPEELEARKVSDLTTYPFSPAQPGELWETKDGDRAVVFHDGTAVVIGQTDFFDLAVQVHKSWR